MPIVSVIMPCFNSEKFIEASIQSVLNQTFKNFELIIIYDDQNKYVRSELPKVWSARLNVPNKKTLAHKTPALAVGIKILRGQGKLISNEPCMVKAESVFVWRDIYWLSTPNKTEWNVPENHIFILGDCPAASRDSRQWGSVPFGAIQGTVLRDPFFQKFPAWLSHN